jgi:hypothetical protein
MTEILTSLLTRAADAARYWALESTSPDAAGYAYIAAVEACRLAKAIGEVKG